MNNKEKDFLDKLAHDLRTPLSVIQTFLSIISEQLTDNELQAFRETALHSLEKVKQLVNTLTNIGSPKSLKKGMCDVAELIRNVFSELRITALEKRVRLTYVGPEHLIGIIDSLMLERVIQNLVKNAIQASDAKSGKYVEVHLFQNNRNVLIDIKDNGFGIDPENINRIFGKGVTIGKDNGSGIGLTYCKEVIEKNGGTISVHSQLGKGTLFSIVLPMRVLAACDIAPVNCDSLQLNHLMQIWAVNHKDQRVETWIERWQGDHSDVITEQVAYHRYMVECGEDSIGMY